MNLRKIHGWIQHILPDSMVRALRRGKHIILPAARYFILSSRKSFHIARDHGIGDVLMCTPALRRLKEINPHCRVYFYTEYPDLVRGLPYIDEALPFEKRSKRAVFMRYEHDLPPPPRHLAKVMGWELGVNVKDVKPDCYIDEKLVQNFKSKWASCPRPHILVQRHASNHTPNKNWPEDNWKTLIDALLKSATIIEIGDGDNNLKTPTHPNHIDLRGKTTLTELVACIAAMDAVACPVSSVAHIAAAVGTPAVVILGGYELPQNTAYFENKILFTSIECSPCWLSTPCPIDRACLRRISPETVKEEIDKMWETKRREVNTAV